MGLPFVRLARWAEAAGDRQASGYNGEEAMARCWRKTSGRLINPKSQILNLKSQTGEDR